MVLQYDERSGGHVEEAADLVERLKSFMKRSSILVVTEDTQACRAEGGCTPDAIAEAIRSTCRQARRDLVEDSLSEWSSESRAWFMQQMEEAKRGVGYEGTGYVSCSQCQLGSYNPSAGLTFCASCPASKTTAIYSSKSASECVCLAGYFLLVDGSCQPCFPGTFKPAIGNGECTVCGTGKFAIGDGSTDASLCICKQGYFGADCLPCAAGSYKNSTGSGDYCSITSIFTKSDSNTSCVPCEPGTNKINLGDYACVSCPENYYSEAYALDTACKPCPAFTTSAAGSSRIEDCQCVAGYTNFNGSNGCVPCAAGPYKNFAASFICTLCPENTYSSAIGATSVLQCTSCPLHSTSIPGASKLEDCKCDSGFQKIGVDCVSCGLGRYGNGTEACKDCPADTYSITTLSASVASCLPCPSNSVAPSSSVNVLACRCKEGYTANSDGVACAACQSGYYKNYQGKGPCVACAIGFYMQTAASVTIDDCLPCPALTTTLANGSSLISSCLCQVGYYKDQISDNACTPCPSDTFSAQIGAVASTTCKPCFTYAKSAAGSYECSCVPGYYRSYSDVLGYCLPCPSGTYYDIALKSCQNCPASTYNPDIAVIGACLPCPNHSHSNTNGSTQISSCSCDPGYYNQSLGVCVACVPGKFKTADSPQGKPCEVCSMGFRV
ncbi:hypothetical protein GUITHDRAFT_120460 [Guillardia theta CCMP2712]|uniref:EGF-like domain-containing protein n=1 Tax=Guillardia theta (strain CCMP2712) TaxID=905079 RepID=L1IAV6_GUITC|nr:hypothetical protein GUITHDRAFT_120460 [Guillardia theta CCMP2712]EKX33343.1 hypothetical protein GUITHDRAFT_120460 [Guillardia theta CCMP2712]|eukprot:XP_005820323.1 hypothetical protein GUITHDRAFT_120460 [Guillardia theta CCMP2712]